MMNRIVVRRRGSVPHNNNHYRQQPTTKTSTELLQYMMSESGSGCDLPPPSPCQSDESMPQQTPLPHPTPSLDHANYKQTYQHLVSAYESTGLVRDDGQHMTYANATHAMMRSPRGQPPPPLIDWPCCPCVVTINTATTDRSQQVRILSIDGGGVRGLIAAIVLADLEERTGKAIVDLFDVVIGTSTGALVACALCTPSPTDRQRPRYTARDIVKFYRDEAANIFRPLSWSRWLGQCGTLGGPKYDSANFERILGRLFGDAKLSDSLVNLCVVAYEIEQHTPFVFASSRSQRDEGKLDFYLRDICRGSTAAPTFFAPAHIKSCGSGQTTELALVDGALIAPNPTARAVIESSSLFRHVPFSHYLVVSVGTGSITKPIYYGEARDWGQARWILPSIEIMFSGATQLVHDDMLQLFPAFCGSGNGGYLRLQTVLEAASNEIDDASPHNLHALSLDANKLVRQNTIALVQLADFLLNSTTKSNTTATTTTTSPPQ